MEVNGEKTSDDEIIAEEFNRHFISVFTKESEDIPEPDRMYRTEVTNIDIDESTTKKYMKEVNPSKSQGPDNIHPRVINECHETLGKPLTDIFTKSLEQGILPREWKHANVTAIFKKGKKQSVENYFKKGKKQSVENYRPISVTPTCCRIMKKM